MPTLPPPFPDQVYVTVSAISAGTITLPDHCFVTPADKTARRTVPSLSFLITHPGPPPNALFSSPRHPFHLLFDLGLRKSPDRYPKVMQRHLENRRPFSLEPGVKAQLEAHGLSAGDINAVMLSHVHYDHHGDPEDFPDSTFVIGPGAGKVLRDGLGGTASHQHFEKGLLDRHKVVELPPVSGAQDEAGALRWKELGPMPAALDLFGDGSVFVVDTPGHLPGHLNLLCRIVEKKWLCLCGDAFHDPRLLSGEKEIGTWEDETGVTQCIHVDEDEAARSIARLRDLRAAARREGVEVDCIAAHDEGWTERNRGAFLSGVVK